MGRWRSDAAVAVPDLRQVPHVARKLNADKLIVVIGGTAEWHLARDRDGPYRTSREGR